jgi:hypothetical protein
MIASDQDPPVPQLLTPPDALLMPRTFVLVIATAGKGGDVAVRDRPRTVEVAGPHRRNPIAVGMFEGFGRATSGRRIHAAERRTNL